MYWISQFGVPLHISSDRGTQFTSQLWSSIIVQFLGIQLHHSTAYHLQSNGLVEHFHCNLKAALRARLSGSSWTRDLPRVLLGIWTAPKENLGCSFVDLVYDHPLRIPRDFISDPDNPADRTSKLFHW